MTIEEDKYYLEHALLTAQRSVDPSTRVGAVLTVPAVGKDGHSFLVSSGCNSFPRGIVHSSERWTNREEKLKLVVHAEMVAVLDAARQGYFTNKATLYLAACEAQSMKAAWGGSPCTRCTVELLQAGIVRVVTYPKRFAPTRWHEDITFAERLWAEAGVNIVYLEPPV